MEILSKAQSANIIARLNLNRVPEIVCGKYDAAAIASFCDKNVANKYILRDLEHTSGKFFLCHDKQECLTCAKEYTNAFSLAVSCFDYKNIVLLGEVCLTKTGITIAAGNDKDIHHRNIYEKAIINTQTTLDDDKIWEVDGVEELVAYIVKHQLYDMIIEFVVYDRPVGVNHEKVLIVELRSNY